MTGSHPTEPSSGQTDEPVPEPVGQKQKDQGKQAAKPRLQPKPGRTPLFRR